MESEIFNLIIGGGGGLALTGLLFYLHNQAQAERRAAQDRYMTHLESENAELRAALDDEDEKPTRPLPSRDRIARISTVKS